MERDPRVYSIFPYKRNFNSHAHVERDNPPTLETKGYKNFNSHAHVERDYRCGVYFAHYINFNSHAHVERDLLWPKKSI